MWFHGYVFYECEYRSVVYKGLDSNLALATNPLGGLRQVSLSLFLLLSLSPKPSSAMGNTNLTTLSSVLVKGEVRQIQKHTNLREWAS